MRLQRAAEVAWGFWAATSAEPLGREWASALASCAEEEEELHYRLNADRKGRRFAARYGL